MDKTKILIVEDDVALEGRPLEADLQKNGFDVVGIAKSAKQAVAMALKTKPDIVIMDIMLSRDDPLGGVKAASQILAKLSTHIIYLTGVRITDTLLLEVKKTRYSNFLLKPYDEDHLVAVMKLALLKSHEKNSVFICYSHADSKYMEELQRFLAPLSDVGIDAWADTKIKYGSKWQSDIQEALRQAKAAVMLVSIDFINSKFIKEIELPSLLKKAEKEGTLIIPVFVRPVPDGALSRSGISQFQGINSPKEPLSKWSPTKRENNCWRELCDFLENNLLGKPSV